VPKAGIRVSAVCFVQLELESFSAQATTGSGGVYRIDLDVPGNLRTPSPNRRYTCQVFSDDACVEQSARFAASRQDRPLISIDLLSGRDNCAHLPSR
jgi:hypothetical protein